MPTYIVTGSNCRHMQDILLNCEREEALAIARKVDAVGKCKYCSVDLGEVYVDGVTEEYAQVLRNLPQARDMSRF